MMSSSSGVDVQTSLLTFLQSKVSDVKRDDIDEIVLNYVTSILEDLGNERNENVFDAEDFCELLFAYIPSASGAISSEDLTSWIFQLADEQRRKETDRKGNFDLKSVIEETTNRTRKTSESTNFTANGLENGGCGGGGSSFKGKRITRLSETSDGGSEHSLEGEEFQNSVDQLSEMFPDACSLEVAHCLTLAAGDVKRAAHLIIHRIETEQSLQPTDRKFVKIPAKKVEVNEKDIKDRIVGKYGYVDQAEDLRYHRPSIKKLEEKKLIRYRDGKIVSTKGERFTQVTKQESEEMKKSYY